MTPSQKSERISAAMRRRKITAYALSKGTGISPSTIGRIVKGENDPNLSTLTLIANFLNVSVEWLETGTGDMSVSEQSKANENVSNQNSTPYFPDVNASAGLNFLSLQNKPYSVPISIPNVKADAFINVFGDSMYPKYCSGEIIGIKEVEKDMVMFGHAYVIQMKDGEAYLKYIKKGADDQHWLLVSENDHYEPREFHLKYIDKVYIIKAVITKTTLM